MSDTHNKLWYGNNYNHWNILDLVLDLNCVSFSDPNLISTHFQTLNPNHQFSHRIWYVEYHSVHAHMAWSQKFRLTPAAVLRSTEHPEVMQTHSHGGNCTPNVFCYL